MTKNNLGFKHLLSLLIGLFFVFSSNSSYSQGINIFDIDTTNYPIIKAKFYAYDKDGKIQRPTKDQLKIIENGTERKIVDVSCPIKQPIAISSVLTFDVSGSMSGGNLDLAKTAAKSWIAALPNKESQAAITSFDHQNYIIQDFTNDKNKLLKAIEKLNPQGGTDYNQGFIEQMGGGILMAKTGKFKRVLIFLTDGRPNFEPDVQKIINEAKINNITIFAVTLGMNCPQILKDISLQTDGFWYENVTTLDDAQNIYLEIMRRVQDDPCDISWESGVSCDGSNVKLELNWQSQKSKGYYTKPAYAIASLSVKPISIYFGGRLPFSNNDTIIQVTAGNIDMTLTNIKRKYGVNDFEIINANLPILIPKNTSIDLTLRFTPTDSSKMYASFEIETNKCNAYFSANGGFNGQKMKMQTLKLTHPNGGESFLVGSDTVITWEGIGGKDEVTLSFSNDSGKVWKVIDTNAINFKHLWENIPAPTNNKSLIKVEQKEITTNENSVVNLLKLDHNSNVYRTYWSPDGTRIATSSYDGTGKIWDAYSGNLLLTLDGNLKSYWNISWSPNSEKVATSGKDYSLLIWNAYNGELLTSLIGHNFVIRNICWSPDGSKVATASEDKTGKIWDANTGKLLSTLKGHTDELNYISWSPDGLNVATSSDDYSGKIWDANTGNLVYTYKHNFNVTQISWSPDGSKFASSSWDKTSLIFDSKTFIALKRLEGHTSYVYNIIWSPDGSKVATASEDKTGKIWDANTGKLLYDLKGHSGPVNNISWSPDGTKVATASNDGKGKIWDVSNGKLLYTLDKHLETLFNISWSPDGTKVATSSIDKTALIWGIDPPIQSDQSDAVFSIASPEVKARDVDMKMQLVVTVKDSVIVGFIENIGSYKCRIDSIFFEGEQFDEFQVVSGIPVFTVDVSKNYNVEFRFKPKAVGIRKSTIVIITQADTLRYKITGEGIQPMVQVLNNFIDFGKVNVKENKDSLQAKTIKNVGSADLKITKIYQYGPNLTDFTEITPIKDVILKPNEELKMDLRFTPKYQGRTSGTLMFEYEGIGSPAVVQLFGEGISNNPNCDGRGFVFENFNSTSKIKLVGSAVLTTDSTVRLTDTKSNLVGGVTYGERLALRSSFDMFFSFRMSNGDNNQFIDGSLPGADGFAVLFQNGKNFRTTANGGSLGFNGIENCVALEIDMYKNDNDFFDPNGNHVALQVPKDNIITAEHSAARTVAMNDQIFVLRPDSTVYYGKLVYDSDKKQIQFFLDSTNKYNNLVLTADNFDFSQYLQLELGDFAHIGITSTTGAATQIHELLSWEFCSERDEFLSVEDRYYESEEVKQIDNILKLETGNIKEIEVMDITGKVLINKDINNNEVNLNELGISTGIYFIILKDDQNRSHFRKVSVVR